MSREKLIKFLNDNRAEQGYSKSHISMFNPKGCFAISRYDIEKFYDIYDYKIVNGIGEMIQEYSMLRFDFDIKKTKEEYNLYYLDKDKFYNESEVKFIIDKIQNRLSHIIQDYKVEYSICCLFEKDIYEKNDKFMSGGFHLQFPWTFLHRDVVINHIIEPLKEEVLNETGLEFDIGVYKNPWLMYGASKSEKHKPYILTKIYDVALKEMTVLETFENYKLYDSIENQIEIKADNIDKLLPRILSIIPFGRECQEAKPNLQVKMPIVEKRKPKINDDREVEEKLAECRKLLPLLSESRVDDYGSWFSLGCVLYSIGNGCDEALDLWDEKSQESSKYDAGCCESYWDKMKVGEYTIGTLKYWAKQDNPYEYELLYKKKDCWVSDLINNLTDINCAKKFKEFNEGEIFYTESHKWVIFNKNTKFWSFNNNKDALIFPVSNFFTEAIHNFQKEFVSTYNPNDDKDSAFYKLIHKAYKKVGMSKFASGVISQLQSLLTENNDVMDKFDTNPYLIAFKDGRVIDLKESKLGNIFIRDIVKEDFIITHTGYKLPERDDKFIITWKKTIRSMVKTDDDLKSVLSALSCFIYGGNTNELFFVFTGTGGNGKGVLDKSLSETLGNYYKTINITQLTTYEKDGNRANSELAKCQYARCVMTSEPDTDKGSKLITPTIKKWTGNDLLTCRELHGKSFQFAPRFTLGISTNGVPDLSVNDGGIQRRMKIIELPFKFVDNEGQELEENQKYGDSSLKELITTIDYKSAMLYLLIDTWIENKGKFYVNETIKNYTNNYFESQNPVKIWFNENYNIDESGRESANGLLQEYRNETEDFTITPTKFGKLMKEFCPCITSGGIKYKCKSKNENNELPRLLR